MRSDDIANFDLRFSLSNQIKFNSSEQAAFEINNNNMERQ